MKRIFNPIICTFFCASMLLACKQELCQWNSVGNSSSVRFLVDWSQSNIETSKINNLSAYGYPEDGGAPYLRVSGDIESSYINLPSGEYSLLLFNDIVGDIVGMSFNDVDLYDEFSAQIIERELPGDLYYTIGEGEILASTLGQLSAWRMDSFEVLPDMVICSYCGEDHDVEDVVLTVEPTPITTQCIITVRIENLDNAQIIQGILKGFARGAYLATGERVSTSLDTTTLYSVLFSSRTYDSDDSSDGVVEAEIITFGKDPKEDQIYELELDIILNSGEYAKFTRDITEQVIEQDNVKIIINLDTLDNLISLPESDGTGFGVNSWGDRESIELM
ncbi:MAG: DUF5119 domain-containing protein [Rikenellaceae bacterium]